VDEMTALREFRAAVRAPEAEKLAAARGLLLAATTTSPKRQRTRLPDRLRWPHLAITGAIVAGTAAALLAALLVVGGSGPLVQPANAAVRVLQRAATAALGQPAPRGSQFIYTQAAVTSVIPVGGTRTNPVWATAMAEQQMWQSVNGSRPGAFAIPRCHAAGRTQSACIPLTRIPATGNPSATGSYAGLGTLPTSPAALLAYLEKPNGCPPGIAVDGRNVRLGGADRAWNAISDILGNIMVLPPRLGHALFEAAARIPGVTLLPSVTDAAGQRGVAVARTAGGVLRTELIFAPRSYRFIGVADVLLKSGDGLRADTVWAASALIRAGVVNAAPATPAGNAYTPASCSTFMPGLYAFGSASAGPSATGSGSSGS
jgi:hypothetical protein